MTRKAEFYMVEGPGPSSKRHATYDEAYDEMVRLAVLNPDEAYRITEWGKTFTAADFPHLGGMPEIINPSIHPHLYEPVEGAAFPMFFSLPQRSLEEICRTFALVSDKRELFALLWHYYPPMIARLPIPDDVRSFEYCRDNGITVDCSIVRTGEQLFQGVPDDPCVEERAKRRRQLVPALLVDGSRPDGGDD